jgi:hypothetical protein
MLVAGLLVIEVHLFSEVTLQPLSVGHSASRIDELLPHNWTPPSRTVGRRERIRVSG